jgi:hypothetical protein
MIGLIDRIPLLAIRDVVSHMLGGGHPPGATPWLRHSQLMALRALLRQERARLRLRLRLRLILMLRLTPGRGPPKLLLSLGLGRRGGSLALLAREGCLACGLSRLGLPGVCRASLFTQADSLQVRSPPLWPLGHCIG